MGDFRTTHGETAPLPSHQRRRKRTRVLLWAFAGAVAVAGLGFAVRVRREVLASGYVTSEVYAEVRPAVSGSVAEILAGSGDRVAARDLLVRLDSAEEEALLKLAVSQERKAAAELARCEAQLAERERVREQTIDTTTLKLRHAQSRLATTRELHEKGLAAGRALQDQELAVELIESERDALAAYDRGLDEKELAILQRELAARNDAVEQARARLAARAVRAPIDGRVVRYEFSPGERVQPDMVLYEVFGGNRAVLKLRVPERSAAHVKAGQPYRAQLTPYRRVNRIWFRGRVESLRDLIQAENRRTYRVVTCSFDPGDYAVPPGSTADARITVARTSLWRKLSGVY